MAKKKIPENLYRFLPQGLVSRIKAGNGFVPETLYDDILNEAELEQYSQKTMRNDPDALYQDPQYQKQSITGNIFERLGRMDQPRRIYQYVNPLTYQLGTYAKDKDEVAYLASDKLYDLLFEEDAQQRKNITKAHEYMHRGFEKHNLPHLREVEGVKEHMYIYSKLGQLDKLEELRKNMYSDLSVEEFNKKVNKLVSQIDEIAEKKLVNRLDELYD